MTDLIAESHVDAFEAAAAESGDAFVVDIDGYAGPLDVLLTLAREQKVDLIHVSILELADQYLSFVAEARRRDLELAADYLVMAAWLAYLKSRLLLPDLDDEEEPTGEELAAVLAWQLQRLESMRNAGETLMARGRLGRDFFPRGAPERFVVHLKTVFDADLFDLMQAYGDIQRRKGPEAMDIDTVKEEWGDRLCLVGNVSVHSLAARSVEDVEREVMHLIDRIAPGGGFILASGNSLASYCKPENVRAMIDTLADHGHYDASARGETV